LDLFSDHAAWLWTWGQKISGQLLLTYLRQHPVDLAGCGRRSQIRLGTGDFARNTKRMLVVAVTQGVVDDAAGALASLDGPPTMCTTRTCSA
jgi:hypothetical protein